MESLFHLSYSIVDFITPKEETIKRAQPDLEDENSAHFLNAAMLVYEKLSCLLRMQYYPYIQQPGSAGCHPASYVLTCVEISQKFTREKINRIFILVLRIIRKKRAKNVALKVKMKKKVFTIWYEIRKLFFQERTADGEVEKVL